MVSRCGKFASSYAQRRKKPNQSYLLSDYSANILPTVYVWPP